MERSRHSLGAVVVAAAAVSAGFVRSGVSVMPPFRKTEISDADLAALAAYLAPGARR